MHADMEQGDNARRKSLKSLNAWMKYVILFELNRIPRCTEGERKNGNYSLWVELPFGNRGDITQCFQCALCH